MPDDVFHRTPVDFADRRHPSPRSQWRATAPPVNDLSGWREQNPASARPQRRAEVDVLGVEEKAFVEQADGLGVSAADQKAGAADPIDILLATRGTLDPRRHRSEPGIVGSADDLLP